MVMDMTNKKMRLVGCQGLNGDLNKCSECGYTFPHPECECYRKKCNRQLITEYVRFHYKT